MAAEGFAGATTGRIAARAGVSVGSLYQYFPTKDALLAAVMQRHMAQLAGAFEELVESYGPRVATLPLEEGVRLLVRASLDAHAADPALHRVLTEEATRLGRQDIVAATEGALIDLVTALLAARPDVRHENARLVARILVKCVDTLTHTAVIEEPALLSDPAFVDELVCLVTRYLRA